jgi:hypothetical protein
MEGNPLRAVPTESEAQDELENTLTVEQLAAESGMTVRNIRAHQARGLLPSGEASQAIMSFRRAVTEPFESEQPQIFTLSELRARFGEDATPLLLRRAVKLDLITPVGPTSFEVPSPRLLEIAGEMTERGVPVSALLDVVEVMARSSSYVAEAFAKLFVTWVWQPFEEKGRPEEEWPQVLESIERMRPVASQALEAVFQMTMTKTVEDEFGRELQRISKPESGRRRKRR